MVLGLRSKNRKGTSVQVDYVIHVQEIKPWPPSQSLKSLRSVLLQWENGDRSSGSLSPVGPTIGLGTGDGKIEFNESFKLPVILSREGSAKGGKPDVFQKNCLELNLYECRRDKTVKGQLLGSAMIDLAEYGMIKETIILSVPINCKRSFRNTAQPVLYVKIQPFDKDSNSASSRESQSKEGSMDKDGRESVSALMNEEYAEEAEIASFTDDDVSSHSSLNISSSAFETHADLPAQNDHFAGNRFQVENALEVVTESAGKCNGVPALPLETVPAKSVGNPESPSAVYASNEYVSYQNRIPSQSSSMGLSSGTMSLQSDKASSNFPEINLMLNPKKASKQSSSSSIAFEAIDEEGWSNKETRSTQRDNLVVEVLETDLDSKNKTKENARKLVKEENDANCNGGTVQSLYQVEKKPNLEFNEDEKDETRNQRSNKSVEGLHSNGKSQMVMEEKDEVKCLETEWAKKVDNACQASEFEDRIKCPPGNFSHTSVRSLEETQFSQQSQDVSRKLVTSGSDTLTLSMRGLETKGNSSSSDRPKHVKLPVRSSLGSVGSIEKENDDQIVEEGNENDILEDASYGSRSVITDKEIRENRSLISVKSSSIDKLKRVPRETLNTSSNAKVRQLEKRIQTLEAELTESAAIELGLYSIVAEHGSSAKNVHTPARRLSRLYLHACKQWSKEKRASAARSAVTGLVLVAKACGHDVPRLTFWLSNSVVLRAIITEAVVDSHLVSAGPHVEINGVRKNVESKSSSLMRKESTLSKKENKFDINFQDWGDPRAFTTALEKIEAWIFSRIIESVWWQTLTPYMQSATQEGSGQKTNLQQGKNYGRKSSLGNQEQGNLSIDLWKKAFKDACARICPVRAEGHECGCLPFLARLVMEQCVARLDVAMFNAILRESEDEMPTDPVSDPISDSKVLPIPAGKSSFGAGAQLKNAIGNWSRWLTDLFGIDDDDSLVDEKESDNDRWHAAASFKPFHLLNALSDLLMLPKDMLLDRSIRKEVFPTFGAPLIKRVLESFVPDEFCPDPIPVPVLESLDSEDANEANEDSIQHFPCCASPIVYSPPSVASVSIIIGDLGSHSQLRRSRSSVLRKCHTSDDELDEVESPLTSILVDATRASSTSTASWKSKKNYGPNVARYQLLREVWRDED